MVDPIWVERNLGFDPIARSAPASTFSFAPAERTSNVEDLQREIIDFDSESPEGREFLAFTTATGISRFTDVRWSKGLEPKPDKATRTGPGGRLPTADVLVVTWTVDEGHALSRVLTPGKDARNEYRSYPHNIASISRKMRSGCLHFWRSVCVHIGPPKSGEGALSSSSPIPHMSQDGPKLRI